MVSPDIPDIPEVCCPLTEVELVVKGAWQQPGVRAPAQADYAALDVLGRHFPSVAIVGAIGDGADGG